MIDALQNILNFRTAMETMIYRRVYLKTMVRLLLNKVYKKNNFCWFVSCCSGVESTQIGYG